jgi:hypothetical protein
MKLKMLLIACILMLSVRSMLAQSTDSLSGTWKGDMGPSATTRIPLIVEMKLNDQRGVSGVVTGPPNPGEIRSGSFDPKTGALKFEVLVKSGGNGAVVRFDGAVVGGVATGRVEGNNVAGDFKITKVSLDATPLRQCDYLSANDGADSSVKLIIV